MSGTDSSRPPDWSAEGPVFVLVRPQMGENIGAAARAMWNFGLRRMRIVDPRDGWPNPRAIAMASGAGSLLEDAQIFPTTAEAVADAQIVYATTARSRELTKRVITPEEAMAEAHGLIGEGARVAVLFGPERAGLETSDVVLADAIVQVPANPAFASLNLGQCVLLTAYEWRRGLGTEAGRLETGRSEIAASADVGRMVTHLVEELDRTGFFYPEHKRPSMLTNLENLFRRAPLTDQDVRTLRGAIRALAERERK